MDLSDLPVSRKDLKQFTDQITKENGRITFDYTYMHDLFKLNLEIKNDNLWFIDILADSKLQAKLYQSCSIGAFFKAQKHNIGTGPDASLEDYMDFVYEGVME